MCMLEGRSTPESRPLQTFSFHNAYWESLSECDLRYFLILAASFHYKHGSKVFARLEELLNRSHARYFKPSSIRPIAQTSRITSNTNPHSRTRNFLPIQQENLKPSRRANIRVGWCGNRTRVSRARGLEEECSLTHTVSVSTGY